MISFIRMKISAAKTNIISSDKEYTCQLSDHLTLESDVIKQVTSYKYLGTSSAKGVTMVSRANSSEVVILRTNKNEINSISSSLALWCNVALQGWYPSQQE